MGKTLFKVSLQAGTCHIVTPSAWRLRSCLCLNEAASPPLPQVQWGPQRAAVLTIPP